MEFLAGFFTSLFVSNLFLAGKGVSTATSLVKKEDKGRVLLLLYYFIAALLLALASYGISYLEDFFTDISYFYVLILVGVMVLVALLFYLLTIPFQNAHTLFKEEGVRVLLSSAIFAVALSVLTLAGDSPSLSLLLANIVGLPFGYLVSILVFIPIRDRIAISNAPKGFKGEPLILISSCIIILAFAALSF